MKEQIEAKAKELAKIHYEEDIWEQLIEGERDDFRRVARHVLAGEIRARIETVDACMIEPWNPETLYRDDVVTGVQGAIKAANEEFEKLKKELTNQLRELEEGR